MAARDEILDYAAKVLDLASFPDYGPQGLQVAGAEEVTKIVCAVSSSLELFERAGAAGAQLVVVHHGLLWDNEPRVIGARVRRRLQSLFDADLTLAAYHLALDAHPEIGNNALLAGELGVEDHEPFAGIGRIGRLPAPEPIETFLVRVRERIAPRAARLRGGTGARRTGRDRVGRRRAPSRRGGRSRL